MVACRTKIDYAEYLIKTSSWEIVSEEKIILKDIVYDNKSYTAKMSGDLVVEENGIIDKVFLQEQKVEFKQVYGNIWKTEVTIKDENKTISIFARRASEGNKRNVKNIECENVMKMAWQADKYGEINYLFISYAEYLYH